VADDPAERPPPGPGGPGPTPAVPGPDPGTTGRAAAIYGAYAVGVLIVQVVVFAALDETSLPLAAPACLLVLPALAWAAGYVTLGAAFRGEAGPVNRAPKLGAAICLVPNALLCGCLGVLTLLR
jgi:hypothetical protein